MDSEPQKPPLEWKWRVTQDGPPDKAGPWKRKGDVLPMYMTDAAAAEHERVTGRKLEKVPGSEFQPKRPDEYGGPNPVMSGPG